MELAYTTAGGVVGAVVSTYLSRNQERRESRAAVMEQLHRSAEVRYGVDDLVPGRGGPRAAHPGGRRLPVAHVLAVTAVLGDGRDAERTMRETTSDLVVAALSAGVPRRVADFAAGGEERALDNEVVRLADVRLGGVLGPSLDELLEQGEEYCRDTAQLLLRALWRPWWTRWRVRADLRGLRRRVEALHRGQQAAVSALARPEHLAALAGRTAGGRPQLPPPADDT